MPCTDELRIVPLSTRDVPEVKAFLRATYGPSFYGADDVYFDWFYLRNPCSWFAPRLAKGSIPVNAIRSADGQIGAVHAYLPFDAATPWGGNAGVWDIEWINGSGISGAGRALVHHLLRDVDVYGGFGCNELSEKAFRKIGLEVRPEIPRCVWLLDAKGLDRAAAESGVSLAMREYAQQECRAGGATFHPIALESVPEAVFRPTLRTIRWGAGRCRAWFDWRYSNHPFIRYDAIGADPAGLDGIAVVRLESVAGTELKVCRIVDFFVQADRLPGLLAAVIGFAKREGCLLADYFNTSNDVAARVRGGSVGAGLDVLANPRLPFMFQPLAMASRNSINFVSSSGEKAAQPIDFGDFYATKADANQDILRTLSSAPVLGSIAAPGTAAGSRTQCP